MYTNKYALRLNSAHKYLSAVAAAMILIGCKSGGKSNVLSEPRGANPTPTQGTQETFTCPANQKLAHTKIRLVAANLSSGNSQSYDPGEGKRILTALKPDVVMIQEFNYKSKSDADYQEFADSVLGAPQDQSQGGNHFFVEKKNPAHTIPNGLISRFPIINSGQWADNQIPDRDFAWARVDIPGQRELFAISVHLKASSDSKSRTRRQNQATELMHHVAEEVSPNDFTVIGGDFNTAGRMEPCLDIFMGRTQIPGLSNPRFFSDKHVPVGYQISNGQKIAVSGTNANRRNNYDWVLPDTKLDQYHTAVELNGNGQQTEGVNFFPEGLVFDTRTFIDLTQASPAQQSDSGAVNMQHMAVVRDFSIPYCESAGATPQTDPSNDLPADALSPENRQNP